MSPTHAATPARGSARRDHAEREQVAVDPGAAAWIAALPAAALTIAAMVLLGGVLGASCWRPRSCATGPKCCRSSTPSRPSTRAS